MRTFKDIQAFKHRNAKAIAWDDYFKLDGKLYTIYEYGGGSLFHLEYDYVYFLNKKTGNLIYVQYDCPSYQYVNGERVQTKEYALRSVELQDYKPDLWR